MRRGRITSAQHRALNQHFQRWRLHLTDGLLNVQRTFGRRAPLTMEIGFGNGEILLDMARTHPERDFIGIEMHAPGIGHLLLGMARHEVGNLRIYQEEATQTLERCIPEGSLAQVLMLFPDPWPKKRHHKRRLLSPNFIDLLVSRLEPGGAWCLAMDWPDYIEAAERMLGAHPQLQACQPNADYRLSTRFERRAIREGREVREFLFRRSGQI